MNTTIKSGWPSNADEAHEFGRTAMAEDRKRRSGEEHDAELLHSFTEWVAAGRPLPKGSKGSKGGTLASGRARLTEDAIMTETVRVLQLVGHELTASGVRRVLNGEGIAVDSLRIKPILEAAVKAAGVSPKPKAEPAPKVGKAEKAAVAEQVTKSRKGKGTEVANLDEARALAAKKAGRDPKAVMEAATKAATKVAAALEGSSITVEKGEVKKVTRKREVTPIPKRVAKSAKGA